MRERICSFLVVLLLMFSGKISGQQVPVNDTVWQIQWDGLGKSAATGPASKFFQFRQQGRVKLPIPRDAMKGFDVEKMLRLEAAKPAPTTPSLLSMNYLLKTTPLSSSYYASRLGFICKKELQLDRISPVALRFRLGSLDYVNWMEGKSGVRPVQ